MDPNIDSPTRRRPMKGNGCVRRLALLGSLALSLGAAAHEPEQATPNLAPAIPVAMKDTPGFVQDIAPDAGDAVKVVDAFSAAIKNGKIDEAAKFLDAKVLILESG